MLNMHSISLKMGVAGAICCWFGGVCIFLSPLVGGYRSGKYNDSKSMTMNRKPLYRWISMAILLLSLSPALWAQPQKSYTSSEILLSLKKLNTAGKVLYVAAHPDDENTRLLSYLANERVYKTAYASLTRGDGGQNLIGNEQGPMLGLIRSYELMAARSVDGAQQFFTRAYDFGYSKNPEETFNIWNRDTVLSDLVFIIRLFKPDVIITRFGTDGSGGHGHHTASAIIAEEAFEAAASKDKFPHQLKYVDVWQAKRIVYNNAGRFRNPNADMTGNIPLNVGKYNPLIGKSYGEIAGLSRSMHKSQGFGSQNFKGEITEFFKHVKGVEAREDIFDDVPTGLERISGARNFQALVSKAMSEFDHSDPSSIVPVLLEARKAAADIKDAHWKKIKVDEVNQLIQNCLGLWVEANTATASISKNDSLKGNFSLINRSGHQLYVDSISIPGLHTMYPDTMMPQEVWMSKPFAFVFPAKYEWTGPYWMKSDPKDGIFQLDDQRILAEPVNSGNIKSYFHLKVNGTPLVLERPLMYKWVDPVQGEQFRMMEVIPEVIIKMQDNLLVFNGNVPQTFQVTLSAGRDKVAGRLTLESTKDFRIEPAFYDFDIEKKNTLQVKTFTIYPLTDKGKHLLQAKAKVVNQVYDRDMKELQYNHIPFQMVFPAATANMVCLPDNRSKNKVAYILGPGDDVAKGISQMGYQVTEMKDATVEKTDLSQFETIVVGIRAFNDSEILTRQLPRLFEYAEQGGTLILQYNTNSWAGPLNSTIGPEPFTLTRDRVTDELAEIRITDKSHPALNFPHVIGSEDFDGWVQERGLYFGKDWSDKYQTPLSMNDPGEKPTSGGLLILPHGKGYYVYTGISFFRQIPNGVPGAFKLLANLIELGRRNP